MLWCHDLLSFIMRLANNAMKLWRHILCQKATIHQVTTMLSTSKNVLFPGHNHLLTTSADDLIL